MSLPQLILSQHFVSYFFTILNYFKKKQHPEVEHLLFDDPTQSTLEYPTICADLPYLQNMRPFPKALRPFPKAFLIYYKIHVKASRHSRQGEFNN